MTNSPLDRLRNKWDGVENNHPTKTSQVNLLLITAVVVLGIGIIYLILVVNTMNHTIRDADAAINDIYNGTTSISCSTSN